MWRIVIVLVIVGLCVHTAAALPGSGTQQDPWRIQSLADFDEFAADPNYWSGFTRLETDVNLAGRTYTTAVIAPDVNNSTWWFDGTPFTGVFEGNNHKLTGLTIDDGGAGNEYLGLFGYIGEDSQVMNLGLEGVSVSGRDSVGGLVGGNGGFISNCYSTGDINGFGSVGGLTGINGGSISNCYSTGDVNGVGLVGGLVGENWGCISNCYSSGSISGNYGYVGGLVGENSDGTITDCYFIGNVNGRSVVGGLVGWNSGWNDGSILNCYSKADVNGVGSVGGLTGNNGGSISNCYSIGFVSGGSDIGGLVGGNGFETRGGFAPGWINNCYSTGSVKGDSSVGGLVGRNYCYSSISNCYSTGDVNGECDIGSLVGHNGLPRGSVVDDYPGYIFNSFSTGSVHGAYKVGGLVGYNEIGDIGRSFWDVETSGEPNMCGEQGEYATGCDPNCGKTTAKMKTKSTFTEAGWDFIEIWGIGENQTYPYLSFAPAGDLNLDSKVDLFDLAIFASHWLEEN